ncbi:MAG: iron-sulfur cluster assembly scaffold protein [Candidatus Nanoarchaeia archaeon]
MYTKKVMEHFRNPKNMGNIKNADAIGTAGNPICGDVMKLYLKIKDGKIKDIKFETMGCAAAIATTSVLTTLVKGKTIDFAKKVTKQDIVDALGGLPPVKMHCSNLATEALKAALNAYCARQKKVRF